MSLRPTQIQTTNQPMSKHRILNLASRDSGLIVHAENDHDANLRARLHVFRVMGLLYVEKDGGKLLRFKLKKDTHLL